MLTNAAKTVRKAANVGTRSSWSLSVLGYHCVGEREATFPPGIVISRKNFEYQLQWLRDSGYSSICAADLETAIRDGAPMPEKSVLLTFDDGYASLCDYVFPALIAHGLRATVFVVTRRVGGTNTWDQERGWKTLPLLSVEQIRYWAAQGIDFGAHSQTHCDLATLDETELRREVVGSARDMMDLLGRPARSFAYPYGTHSEQVRQCVAQHFALAFTCDGGVNDVTAPPLMLRRTMVHPADGHRAFLARLKYGRDFVADLRGLFRLRTRVRNSLRAFPRIATAEGTAFASTHLRDD